MESRLLDDLPLEMARSFSAFIRTEQTAKHPYIRNGGNLSKLEKDWAEWISLQDIPMPIVRTYPSRVASSSNNTTDRVSKSMPKSAHPPPVLEEDIFVMDGDNMNAPSTNPIPSSSPWKSATASRKVDMKSIMEAEKVASTPRGPEARAKADGITRSPIPASTSSSHVVNPTTPHPLAVHNTRIVSTSPGSKPWKQATPPSPITLKDSPSRPAPSRATSSTASPLKPKQEGPLGPLIVPIKNDGMKRRVSGYISFILDSW